MSLAKNVQNSFRSGIEHVSGAISRISLKDFCWVLPVAGFILLAWRFATNAPSMDDFTLLIRTVDTLSSSEPTSAKLGLLFGFSNEHHVTVPKFLTWFISSLQGRLDLRILSLVGASFWVAAIILAVYRFPRASSGERLSGLPVALVLSSCVNWQSIIWPTASMIWNIGLFLVLVHFFLLVQNSRRAFLVSLFTGVVAMWTFGGALLIIPCGLAHLVFISKQRWRAASYFVFFAIAVALYFVGYRTPTGHSSAFEALRHVVAILHYAVVFVGNLGFGTLPAYIVGSLVVLFAFLVVFKRWYVANPFPALVLLFVLLSAAAAGATRHTFGTQQALASRYAAFALLALASIYGILAPILKERLRGWFTWVASLSGTILFALGIATAAPSLELHRTKLLDGLFVWSRFGATAGLMHPNGAYVSSVLKSAERSAVYLPALVDFEGRHEAWPYCGNLRHQNHPLQAAYSVAQPSSGPITVDGWAFQEGRDAINSEILVVLVSDDKTLAFVPMRRRRPDVTAHFATSGLDLDDTGFVAYIDPEYIPPGNYQVGVLVRNGTASGMKVTDPLKGVRR